METDVGATTGRRVLYLYGVVPRGQPLPAHEAAPLEAVPHARLVAVVEPVCAREFSAEELERKLQCVGWVAPLARRHAAVLEAAMRHGPVVPAGLCTLFTSARALTRLLADNEERFHDQLSWLEGRQEWGLKIFCDEDRLRSTLGARDPAVLALAAAAAAASPGQAYVLGKKRDGRLAEVVSVRIDEVVDEVLDEVDGEVEGPLAALAVDMRQRPLLAEARAGRRAAMVLNCALLVDTTVCPAFHAAAAELAARLEAEGFALELTGPWPAYSFCDLGPSEPGSEEAREP